jgi:hypothetical protein
MSRPVFHQTDIFHPHADPDDHWDLACNYALAKRGDIELQGIMIDYPPWAGDPALAAVAQLNFITGLAVPVVVGSSQSMSSRTDAQPGVDPATHGAANFLLNVLRQSAEPVVINIVGSCRDIALAGLKDPGLFEQKCAAIYLNAGTGSPKKEKAAEIEYNVQRNPASYVAIFDLPCPVYWMPCWDEVALTVAERKVMEWGTHYRFKQSDILEQLSPVMQNYFIYALERSSNQNWLRCLLEPVDAVLLQKYGALERSMWSTASFLHGAGYTVDTAGNIVARAAAGGNAVFRFEPVSITCEDSGITTWKLDAGSTRRFKFHVLELEKYQQAMTTAMRSLLSGLSVTVAPEEARLEVPVELFRGLYVQGSLKNTAGGFQFTLKNNILEAVVNSFDSIMVDGKAYKAEAISVKAGGTVRACSDVCAANPFLLALDAEAVFMVKGPALSPGNHRLEIGVTAELVGKMQFDVTDRLS